MSYLLEIAAAEIICPRTLPAVGYVYSVISPYVFLVATFDREDMLDVPNKLFTPLDEHCANVDRHSGIWA